MASQGSGAGFPQQQQPQQGGGNPALTHQQTFPSATGASATTQPQTQSQMTSPNKSVNTLSLSKLGQETNQELPQMTSPIKSVNTLSLCKLGQETNQELVTKLLELFKLFKTTQLPNSSNNPYQEKRVKIEESLRQLTMIFRKLRVIYQKVSEMIVDPDDNLEQKHVRKEESLRQLTMIFGKLQVIYQKVSEIIVDSDDNLEQVLVPLKGDPIEEKNTDTDVYKFVTEDHKQIIEQIQQKNRQIKEIIDKIRTIIWEINTMIVMRKT